MKKKILLVIVTVALLFGVVGIMAHAGNIEEPVLNYASCSLILENTTYIRYRATVENVASVEDVKLLVWLTPQEEYVYGNQDYTVSPRGTYKASSGGTSYPEYYFDDIATKQMSDNFYTVLYYKVGDQE